MICLFTLVLFGAAVANAQEPRPPKVPVNPEVDMTLLDDTKESGLQPRVRAVPMVKGKPLPVGKRCTVLITPPGQEFHGVLREHAGEWLVMEMPDGRHAWIAAKNVAAVVVEPDRGSREPGDREKNVVPEQERTLSQALRAEAEAMRREVMAMQQRLVQAVEEAARARRESESQRDMAEQLRRRAEEARAVLTEEVERLRDQLRKAAENAAKENTKEEPKE
jgi:hypothetical protein